MGAEDEQVVAVFALFCFCTLVGSLRAGLGRLLLRYLRCMTLQGTHAPYIICLPYHLPVIVYFASPTSLQTQGRGISVEKQILSSHRARWINGILLCYN